MIGVFIYCEPELREAMRALAYRERRTISDVGREALLAATSTPAVIEETWREADRVYVMGRVSGPVSAEERWVVAWFPPDVNLEQGSVRVWLPHIADEASSERWGCRWFESEAACEEFARSVRVKNDKEA